MSVTATAVLLSLVLVACSQSGPSEPGVQAAYRGERIPLTDVSKYHLAWPTIMCFDTEEEVDRFVAEYEPGERHGP